MIIKLCRKECCWSCIAIHRRAPGMPMAGAFGSWFLLRILWNQAKFFGLMTTQMAGFSSRPCCIRKLELLSLTVRRCCAWSSWSEEGLPFGHRHFREQFKDFFYWQAKRWSSGSTIFTHTHGRTHRAFTTLPQHWWTCLQICTICPCR